MGYEEVEVNSERWFDLAPLLNEEFRDIKGYEGLYQVSNYGRIKSLNRHQYYRRKINEHILKVDFNEKGYCYINLCKNSKSNSKRVSKMVATTFLDRKDYKSMPNEDKSLIKLDKLEVNHKNENKLDNHANNLEFCTHTYNINYGNRNIKHKNKMAKKVNQYDLDGNFIKQWNCIIDIQREIRIWNTSISACCKGKVKAAGGYIWRYADE